MRDPLFRVPIRGVLTLVLLLTVPIPLGALAQTQSTANGRDDGGEELGVHHDNGVLLMRSDDGRFAYWLDGRIMLDAGVISGSDNDLAAGTETRRARFAIKSLLYGDWAGELDVDLADNEVDLKDFWVAYVGVERAIFKVGNHKVPVSLEELTTSRWTTFMERALPNALVSGRRIGASYQTWRDHWQLHLGIFGEEPGAGEDEGEDEAVGYAGRFTFTPVRDADRVIHVGASTSTFGPDAGSGDRFRVRQRPELHLTERLLNTGKVKQVQHARVIGMEAAIRVHSLSVQAEYLTARITRMDDARDANYDGWYAFVSWVFGGQRRYHPDTGEFGGVTADGAFEIAARYSTLDLNDLDAGVEGGSAENVTLGLNWYPNANVRLMANYILADHDELADGDGDFLGGDDFSVLGLRIQYLF